MGRSSASVGAEMAAEMRVVIGVDPRISKVGYGSRRAGPMHEGRKSMRCESPRGGYLERSSRSVKCFA